MFIKRRWRSPGCMGIHMSGPPHTALEVARVDAPGLEPSSRCCGEVKECWAHWPSLKRQAASAGAQAVKKI
jgi:hypothetical protein